VIPEQDAEPGKILHEARGGEMAALREIPFGRYYGSVDATPLFVALAGAYYEHTADRAFVESIWPNVEAALGWVDTYGDPDGDGFVEYQRRTPDGLVQQGWKDSHDSVFHSDGTLAEAPIALCEVQGYVYAAKRYAAELARALGRWDRAAQLARQAERLRERFEDVFWCEGLSTYALALDGKKRPCRVKTSNAGQCLFTGIVSPERALRVAETLLNEASFSGWGIRTVAASEARYNPMSYHNGSIWPHDNALIAYGLGRYRLPEAASRVLTGMFDASLFVDLHRMPELFCGFPRRAGQGPTLYPVACAPQAWSAATVFMLLQACLGMRIEATLRRIFFSHPLLPESLQEVELFGLRVGDASIDLRLERHDHDVGVNVLRRDGDVEVVAVL
jgi:glycogen debranching enzyme